MDPAILGEWHYLIYLIPLCAAALLLALSGVRSGHHSAGHHAGYHSAAHHPGGPVHSSAAPHPVHHGGQFAHPAAAHGPAAAAHSHGGPRPRSGTKAHSAERPGMIRALLGPGRAPLPMVIEAFCVGWGFVGFWANEILLKGRSPSLIEMGPSLAAALVGGLICARLTAVLITRLLPIDESFVVSQNALFGLAGTVTFPVSASAGRIHIYDEFGSLHDESCRVQDGRGPIEKGRKAMVMDMDTRGTLIVEEVPETVS